MEYIAHKDGERIQTVKEHLYGTAELAGSFAERFGKKEWGYCCGMLHDPKNFKEKFRCMLDFRITETLRLVTVCVEDARKRSVILRVNYFLQIKKNGYLF